MLSAGVDCGSRAVKALIWDAASGRVLGQALRDSGLDHGAEAAAALAEACRLAGLAAVPTALVATGYGRKRVAGARPVTEISCHGRAIAHLLPGTRSVLEIGGQDAKRLSLAEDGRVADFAMNDRCAAGTGRFLEAVAARFGCDLPGLDALASSAPPRPISSTCVVFAESEITGLLADGVPAAPIAAGVVRAVAERVVQLAGRQPLAPHAITGGGARLHSLVVALAELLAAPVQVPPEPVFTGALGAALIAADVMR